MSIRQLLSTRFSQAMQAAGIPADCQPLLAPSKNANFGEYQANGAMGAAKIMKSNPRAVAQSIVDKLDLSGIASNIEIAGPGFINIYLDAGWLGQQANNHDARHIKNSANKNQTVVVDYSGPNLAKEMHVGHLRSTIIGDAVVRTLEHLGYTVIRQNHVGDWGTQFGMLIAHLESQMASGENPTLALKDLEVFYQQAKVRFDQEPDFAKTARDYVVKLQGGDAKMLTLWQQFRDISLTHSQHIYDQLNVSLTPDHIRGESAYNNDLAPLINELKNQNLATTSEGAQVVFLQELADKEGNPSPVIVQKADGGFLYATTDLAGLRYRASTLNAQRIMYFIDARQSLHMQQVFTIARKAGFVGEGVSLEHLAFGTMMGGDGKPFKTRTGGTVKLADLLDEACERALTTVKDKNPELDEASLKSIANKVGIGAVKYADLCKTRTNDYIFNWDTMLSFEGNTGPYLQYAYTRIQSILRRAGVNSQELNGPILINAPQEKDLALKVLQFNDCIEQVASEALPHLLCTYLYDVASLFMTFYEACPILKEGVTEADKISRLSLSVKVSQVLETGLGLLGIEVMGQM
ncbi:MAG: arginine--tRNA ligase [Marinagarivorans sp.]|nr:arginine--tRNA ligase [Marinagarivorans sp.]